MSSIIEASWNEQHLLPPCVEDWVGQEHPARFIREFVEGLDLAQLELSERIACSPGRPSYSQRMLLRLWLYGYFQKIRSSRGLEKACADSMGFIWLSGNHRPDHNTLWRFWKNNRQCLRQLFLQTVKVALKMDLVDLASIAIDGTKLQSACSTRGSHGRDGLEKMLQSAHKKIEQLEEQISQNEREQEPLESLPKQLQHQEQLREKIQAALEQVESEQAKYVQPQEPQSRRMKHSQSKRSVFSYNAQASVDSKHQIVVAESVSNEVNDTNQLGAMIEQSVKNTQKHPQEVLADGGYSTGKQLANTEDFNVFMPLPASSKNTQNNPYHLSRFHYDPQKDNVICPEGKELPLARVRTKANTLIRVYQSQRICNGCPVRDKCTQLKRGRSIEIRPHHQQIQAHRQKMATESAKQIYNKRAGIVEPHFAWVKTHDRFNRWTFNGLNKVANQWSLLCAVRNLKKLYQHWAKKQNNRSNTRKLKQSNLLQSLKDVIAVYIRYENQNKIFVHAA